MTALSVALKSESLYVQGVVPRILPILIMHAQNSRTLTYKELSLQTDEVRRLRHLDKPLDAIGRFVRSRTIATRRTPPLETIVVRSGPRKMPGIGADYLLEGFLKESGAINSTQEFQRNRRIYVELVRDEIFSFPWHRIFDPSDLNTSRRITRRRGRATSRSPMDAGVSGTHFRSGGALEGRQNPVVLALRNNLPAGWILAAGAKSKCDLAVRGPNSVKKIFEVKCSVDNQDMCSALGELVFHMELNRPAGGIAVIPGNRLLPSEWNRIFRKHHVPIVEYLSKDGGFEFRNLEAALAAK